MAEKKSIYFDYNATSPVLPEVLQEMLPYFSERFGNSVSAAHSHGWDADAAVEKARKQVADFLHCHPHEIFFTSGATEANNWCLRGLVERWKKEDPSALIHIIASPLEHASVANVLTYLREHQGIEFDLIPVDAQGLVQVNALEKLVRPSTRLLCASWVQNEIGTIQPIQAIAEWAANKFIPVLSDATQALGKVPVDLGRTRVSYLSFSGHKLGGPKGSGFLFIAQGAERPNPLFIGGGHERGFRSSTVNVPAVVGLGAALNWWIQHGESERARIKGLQQRLWQGLQTRFPGIRLNGPPLGEGRSAANLNVTFLGCRVPQTLPGVSASRGSACSSSGVTLTQAMLVLGIPESEADKTLRFSLGHGSTEEDVDGALAALSGMIKPIP